MLEFGHGFFQHLLVQFKPDFPDMARLLLAEYVARPANIKIMAGQFKSGADRIQRLQIP